MSTPADQRVAARAQRAERVCATLPQRAGIVVADVAGHVVQLAIQDGGVRGEQPPPQRSRTRGIIAGTDLDVPAAGRIPEAAQCARVVSLDDEIDGLFELRHRKRAPPGDPRRDLLIDEVQQLVLHDQLRAPRDGRGQAMADVTCHEERGDAGQTVTQRHRLVYLG
jgi:hypothetical protein